MNIIVCVKQVPRTTGVKIDPQTGTLMRKGASAMLNSFDMYAIEEGLKLKESFGGTVTVISMGPPQAEYALKFAISMGCDSAVLLSDRIFAGADTLATSYTLACGIKKIGTFDIILCGVKTTDGDTAQVGPGLAEELKIPHICYVRKIEMINNGHIFVERMMEDSYEMINTPLPCLITVTKEINKPRLPTLKGKMCALNTRIRMWRAKDLNGNSRRFGLDGSATHVIKVFPPRGRKKGVMLSGTPSTQTKKLVEKLSQLKLV